MFSSLKYLSVIAACLLIMVFSELSLAATHIFSDTEGSFSAIDALVEHGKLKWVMKNGVRELEFVNPRDRIIFLGDLSGPNWMDPAHPQNMRLRDTLLSFKLRHSKQVDIVLGNHEYNRLGFIRDNMLMARGQHKEYNDWLKSQSFKDSIEKRVFYWGKGTYGLTKDSVPLPVDQYQKEMINTLGRTVTTTEASEQFAKDLRVGKPGEPHGKMLNFLLNGQESAVRDGWAYTHAPVQEDALGIIPLKGEKVSGGASWLRRRNDIYFQPEMQKFIKDVQRGRVPSDIIPNLGDARWDSKAKRVVHDSASVSYTERPMDGDQYRGVSNKIAKSFLDDPNEPVKGLFSAHKPAGNFHTIHRNEINGRPFLDTVVDVSRGPEGKNSTLSVNDAGEIEIATKTSDGKILKTIVGPETNKYIGMITEDGFQVKVRPSDGRLVLERIKSFGLESKTVSTKELNQMKLSAPVGKNIADTGLVAEDGFQVKAGPTEGRYIMERYKGFSIESKVVSTEELSQMKLSFSVGNSATDKILQGKIGSLKAAIIEGGGQVVPNIEEAGRIVNERFVLDMRGASDWAALPSEKIQDLRNNLTKLANRLNPNEVVILTGGNRARNPSALETLVHDVFAGSGAKKKFDIIGFMKHDTPADEVDKVVKYVVLIGQGDNWDAPVQAAMKFTQERHGASVMIGGGGVLKRSADSEIATAMKDRLYLFTGYGGASEEKVAKGIAVSSMDEFIEKLTKQAPKAFLHAKALKVGVYTGSFDPPHDGHKNIVREFKKQYGIDRVYVVPDKTTTYKPGMQSLEDRNNMIKQLFKDDPSVTGLSQKMQETIGEGQMWDVIKAVKNENPGADLYNVMGTDTFEWYKQLPPDKRPSDVTILVNNRDPKVKLPNQLDGAKVIRAELNGRGFSSTDVRKALRDGKPPKELSDSSGVYNYIKERKLYRSPTDKGLVKSSAETSVKSETSQISSLPIKHLDAKCVRGVLESLLQSTNGSR